MKIRFKTKNLKVENGYISIPMNKIRITENDLGKLNICFDNDFHGITKNQLLNFHLKPERKDFWSSASDFIIVNSLVVYLKDNLPH